MSLNLFLHILAGSAGLLMICMAHFLYEDEEGAIRNRVADLWVTIDDLRKSALTLNAAFLLATSRVTLSMLDTLFGERLLSLKCLRSCSLLSFASGGFSFAFIFSLAYRYGLSHDPYRALRVAAFGLLLLVLGILAARADGWEVRARCGFTKFVCAPNANYSISRRAICFSIAVQLLAVCLAIILPIEQLVEVIQDGEAPIWAIAGFCAVLISDLVFIALTRWILHKILSTTKSVTMLFALFLNAASAVLLNGPFWYCITLYNVSVGFQTSGRVPIGWQREIIVATYKFLGPVGVITEGRINYVLAISATNMLDSLLFGIFVVLIIVTLLHKLVWPLLERPVYAAYRHLLSNKSVLGAFGYLLLIYAFNSQRQLLHLLKALRDVFR